MLSDKIDEKIESLRSNEIKRLDEKFLTLDKKMDEKFLTLDKKMDSQFKWIVAQVVAITISWLIPILLKIFFP